MKNTEINETLYEDQDRRKREKGVLIRR